MSEETIDFDEGLVMDLSGIADAPEREALRPGTYPVEVIDVEFTQSKKGSPMLKWTFQTTEDEHNNTRFWNYTTLDNEIGQRITRDSIIAINPEYDLAQFAPAELAEEMVGRPARVRVGTETYEGRKRNTVKGVLPPEGDGFLA